MSEDLGRVDPDTGVESIQEGALRSDWEEAGMPSTAVVEAVATARAVDPTELPPLNDHIDPDALDQLVQETSSVQVSFVYDGADVFVTSDGAIRVSTDSV